MGSPVPSPDRFWGSILNFHLKQGLGSLNSQLQQALGSPVSNPNRLWGSHPKFSKKIQRLKFCVSPFASLQCSNIPCTNISLLLHKDPKFPLSPPNLRQHSKNFPSKSLPPLPKSTNHPFLFLFIC